MDVLKCTPIVKGNIEGEVLFSRKPISFIGGVDPKTGIIRDALNDCCGESIADKIYVFPYGKGSSGAGLVLLELTRIGKAPKAIVNRRTDTVLMTGPLIAREFYKRVITVINVDEETMEKLKESKNLRINCDKGEIEIL